MRAQIAIAAESAYGPLGTLDDLESRLQIRAAVVIAIAPDSQRAGPTGPPCGWAIPVRAFRAIAFPTPAKRQPLRRSLGFSAQN